MNLKLKRLVRTTSSEQYAVFDLDQTDQEDQLPLTIGKLDLHYTAEGVYGTMLLWDESSRGLRPAYRRAFIQALLEDIIQPMGVPNEYVIEFFAPNLDLYEVFHNVEVEDDADGSQANGAQTDDHDAALGAIGPENDRRSGTGRAPAGRGYVDAEQGDHPDPDYDDLEDYDDPGYEDGEPVAPGEEIEETPHSRNRR